MQKNNEEINSIRVGVIDDYPVVLDGIFKMLQDINGIQVVLKANNGKELMSLLKETEILPHILLMDISMPIMDGVEATKLITDQYPDIKIIAYSAYDDDWSMVQMMLAGADVYLRKDATPQRIRETIYEVYTKGKYEADLFYLYGEGLEDYKKEVRNLKFTENERTYMQLYCEGYNYSEIAEKMELTVYSMDYYHKRICEKLNIKNQALLIRMIYRINQVKLNEPKNWNN